MRYTPEAPPRGSSTEQLAEYLLRELQRISATLDQSKDLEKAYAAPQRLIDGMLRYADGTTWNPDLASGEGFYGYWGGAWNYLGASEFGKRTIWVPAAAMIPRTTGGSAISQTETATNKIMLRTLDFASDATEYAQFAVRMPKSWNEGTVTAQFVWSHAATTTNFGVVWGAQAVAISDDDALDASFGTAQTTSDTGGTTNDLYISAATGAITISGSPAENDYVTFQVYRKHDDGNDTMAVDARLHGVVVIYTTDAGTDD